MMKRRSLVWLLLLVPLLIAVLAAYYLVPRPSSRATRQTAAARLDSVFGRSVNILIIGKDARAIGPVKNEGKQRQKREEASHSDIMIIAHLNLENGRLNLVALPRDMLVEVPGVTAADSALDFNRMEKLTHVHAIGGVRLLRRTIGQLLGITVHRVIAFDFDTFRMTFGVLAPFIGRLRIAGVTLSNRQEALMFARRRQGLAEDDLDRCRNALLFIRAVLSRTWWLANTRLGTVILKQVLQVVGPDTDLTGDEVEALAAGLNRAGFTPARIRTAVLAGQGADVTLLRYDAVLSCYLPAYGEIRRQVARYLLDQDTVKTVALMTHEKFRAPDYLFGNYVLDTTPADFAPDSTLRDLEILDNPLAP